VSGLPDSWLTCTLGDVINYGTTQKSEPVEIPDDAWVLELEDIEKDTSKVLQRLTFRQRQSKSTKNCFAKGDILYGKLRPYLNKVVRADQDGCCTTEIVPIKPNEIVEGAYLFHWLKTPAFIHYVTSVSHGLNMPRLGTEAGKQAPFVLAPLNEQKRIADKLDAVLARVDACRDRLDRIPAILKRFRQSVLAAATSGKLTEDWRTERVGWADEGSPTNEAEEPRWASQAQPNLRAARDSAQLRYAVTVDEADGWTSTDVQTVAQVGTGSTPLRSNQAFFSATGTPWVTSAATAKPIVLAADEFVTDAAIVAHRLKKFPAGTLLVAMYGEGKTRGQVSELGIEATISQACAAVVVDEKRAQKEFVKLALQANYLEMRGLAEGGNQPNLNLSKIKEFPLRLPSRDEQTEIVRRVESLFAYADRLEARYAAARAQVGKLAPAMLAKAFRGELVPQDPNDEPASVLLARIRAQCGEQAANKPKRGRKAAV